jgi:drug/metabolite transporter (DMT)-like permease
MTTRPAARTLVACGLALVGFAANSLLARQALGADLIDAASYTLVRLASGAIMLAVLAGTRTESLRSAGSWVGGASLAVYAAAFSFSYVRIGAALGALVLFPTVKLALLGWGGVRGERPARNEWLGAGLALAGLLTLMRPGAGRAHFAGIVLMVVAGLAWAVYTVAGKYVQRPLVATGSNFVRATVIALPLVAWSLTSGHASPAGLVLATSSGALASGLAYVLWYAAVPGLTGMQMGLAQLAVPALAGIGAVLLLGEHLNTRLVIAAAVIFGGVALALVRPRASPRARPAPMHLDGSPE